MDFRTSLILILILASAALGSARRRTQICYVPADSVVIWSNGTDFRSVALAWDGRITPREGGMTRLRGKDLRQLTRRWREEILPHLNVLGSYGAEDHPEQGTRSATVLQTAARLHLHEPSSRWFDVVERVLWNGLMRTLALEPMNAESHTAARVMLDAAGCIYALGQEGIYVNLFVNNFCHVTGEGIDVCLDQLTSMPDEGRVKIRVSGLKQGKTPLTLRIRIPDWAMGQGLDADSRKACGELPFCYAGHASGQPPITHVNGRPEDFPVEAGYWVIHRKWNNGDEVFFDFPMTPRLLHRRGQADMPGARVAVQRGPLVYAAPCAAVVFPDSIGEGAVELAGLDAAGHVQLQYSPHVQTPDVFPTDTMGKAIILRPSSEGLPVIWHRTH